MEDLGKHISELLFEHDCVIVPSLGGFLASNQPSRVLMPNHTIFPPYRNIAFNVYLKQNDGLLANFLVEAENITYTEALQQIESFTSGCAEVLDQGKKVSLAEIGTLYYDKEKNIQFEAFRNYNHLKDSFGMESVHFLPVQRDEISEKKKSFVEKPIRPSIPPEKNVSKSIMNNKNKRYVGAALLGSALIWFSVNLYLISPKHYESTSLSPFDSQEIVLSKTDSIRNLPSSVTNNTSKVETVAVAPVIVETTDAAPDNNLAVSTVKPENVEPKEEIKEAVSKPIITPQPVPDKKETVSRALNNHYVIAGVFKIKENAQSMLIRLQQLGFSNAQIIEANDRNYVSYNNFASHSEALSLTDSLNGQKIETWIWKH